MKRLKDLILHHGGTIKLKEEEVLVFEFPPHTCIGKSRAKPCKACQLKEELEKAVREPLKLYIGGSRIPMSVVYDPNKFTVERISSRGWWKQERPNLVVYCSYGKLGQVKGKVIYSFPDSVHGPWKLITNQETIVVKIALQ